MKERTTWLPLLISVGLAVALIGLVQFTVWAAPGSPTLDPAPNTHTAPLTTTISISYTESISAATVTSRTVAVHGMQTGLVTSHHGVDSGVIIVNPVDDFFPGELVRASATTRTLTLAGEEPLAPTVWQFRTAVEGGSGRFGPTAHDTFGGGDTQAVALGDLDGDGDLDAVVVNDGSAAAAWLNDGDGTYASSTSFGGGVGWDVALGDADFDGDLDVFLAYRGTEPQEVWFNAGDGTFLISTTFGTGYDARGMALGDLDGDGDLDAVIATRNREKVAFLNDGSGSFPITSTFGSGDSHDVALGDVDLDGDLDAVVANGTRQAQQVWLNAGDGTFPISTTFGAGRTQAVDLGDLDGDGDLDVVLASNSGDPQEAWFNDGNGTFSISTTFGANTSRGIALGDVDGDGDLDAVVANTYDQAQDVWFNDGDGTFLVSTAFGAGYSSDVALGDVDGDGDLDAVLANGAHQSQEVWLNGERFYVDADATGTGDGSSWDDAFPYLQDALDAANAYSGTGFCEIWVAEGTYYPDEDSDGDHVADAITETFTLNYDGIRLYGGFAGGESSLDARDPEAHVTMLSGIVDSDGFNQFRAYHVLWIDGTNESISEATLIDGFKITNGSAVGPSPHDSGGGLYCYASPGSECSPALTNVTFGVNQADFGGGMYNDGREGISSPILTNVTFSFDQVRIDGGAMYNDGRGGVSSPILTNVTFRYGYAPGSGGAMYNNGGSGGTSSPILTNVTFSENWADVDGGGMVNDGQDGASSPMLTNVVFISNTADFDGGGMVNDGQGGTSSPVLTNVTFSDNQATSGGGMYNKNGLVALTNVILWDNSASFGDVMYNSFTTATISYSLVDGGWDGSGIFNNDGGIVIDGGGNIDADPQFVSPTSVSEDYHLLSSSPAIDTGDNGAIAGTTTDRDGHARLRDGDSDGTITVDMGAYEYQRIYVDADVGATRSAGDGSSWTDAFLYLQDALDEANTHGGPCEIWVAEGIYYPDEDIDGDHASGAVSETFTLSTDGIQLYGGFDPQSGADEWSERNWESYPTMLSGDIDGNDTVDTHGVVTSAQQITGTNAYHVVWVDGTSEPISTTTIIDGFTITGGHAVGTSEYGGGGLYCDGSDGGVCSPALSHLVFSGNAAGLGGGMANLSSLGGASNPTLADVIFSGNVAEIGGGMINGGFDGGASSPALVNVIFSGNRASFGGGMYNAGQGGASSPVLVNVLFSGNWAVMGGGMANVDAFEATFIPLLVNVTFSGNQADLFGGAMYNEGDTCMPGLVNVILWGNTAVSGTVMYNDGAEPFVGYSLIEGGCDSGIYNENGGVAHCDGETIIDADPQFMRDPDSGDGDWFTLADNDYGDLRLRFASPAIDAGINEALGYTVPHVTTDLAGNPRFVDVPAVPNTGNGTPPIVDIGAYEMQSTAPQADAGGPYSGDEGSAITLDGSASNANDAGDEIVSFEWDCTDDGVYDLSTSDPITQCTYGEDGAYTARLRVTDGGGLTDTITTPVTIHNVAPVVQIQVEPDVLVKPSTPVTFTGTFTDAYTLDTHVYEWDFDDGETLTGTLTPVHVFDAGSYTVMLTVTDDDGGVGYDEVLITVENWHIYLPLVLKNP